MTHYRIVFSRHILGVPFPIASVPVKVARSPERAQRAAELRLMRRGRIEHWRLCADSVEITQQGASETSALTH